MDGTCDGEAARGEHLDGGLDGFDPVGGGGVELRLVADAKQQQAHGSQELRFHGAQGQTFVENDRGLRSEDWSSQFHAGV